MMDNLTLTAIQKEWEKDCEIDDIELDKSSLHIPKLHAKYSGLLSNKKLALIKYENELLKYATEQIKKIDGIKIYGDLQKKTAVISFNIKKQMVKMLVSSR